jgi:addiction module HigA family antidote
MTGWCDPIHPGKILAEELQATGMRADHLAQALGVSTNHLHLIIDGTNSMTTDTAYRLGNFFGTGPELWLDLQKAYEFELCHQHSVTK